jgi:predicted component of type VI protein secretion system
MAFLQVYFKDELKFTAPLQLATETRIGRASDNHIIISNRGVSGHHATIKRNGDVFYISDNNSTNGLFLNGCRVTDGRLFFGDEITIFKHKLKFIAVDLSADNNTTTTHDDNAIIEDQTVIINSVQLKSIVQEQQKIQVPYLLQTGGKDHGRRWELLEQHFQIGTNRSCQLQTGGLFAPTLSAVITLRDNVYYLNPEKRGNVYVNNKPIDQQVKLKHFDNLQVRGIDLTFCQPTNKDY